MGACARGPTPPDCVRSACERAYGVPSRRGVVPYRRVAPAVFFVCVQAPESRFVLVLVGHGLDKTPLHEKGSSEEEPKLLILWRAQQDSNLRPTDS